MLTSQLPQPAPTCRPGSDVTSGNDVTFGSDVVSENDVTSTRERASSLPPDRSTLNLLRPPFVAVDSCGYQPSSLPDVAWTHYDPTTWFYSFAVPAHPPHPPHFPSSNDQLSPSLASSEINSSALSERAVAEAVVSRSFVKREPAADEAFSWWSFDSNVSAEYDFEHTALDSENAAAAADDFDGSELLEVLADVPNV